MKGKMKPALPVILSGALLAAAVLWLSAGLNDISGEKARAELSALENSVKNAAVLCYSIEGAYPESGQYLEENYGLTYNHDKYIVHYECFGVNIIPNISIIVKGGADEA